MDVEAVDFLAGCVVGAIVMFCMLLVWAVCLTPADADERTYLGGDNGDA